MMKDLELHNAIICLLFIDKRTTKNVSYERSEIDERLYEVSAQSTLTVDSKKCAEDALLQREIEQQLAVWNATQQSYPLDACIHQLVAMRAADMPDAVALVMGEYTLSYRELNQRANRLAHYLQTFGVQSNVLVGLCVERSLDMVVGLLGILKAGGGYVPLDPSYPSERLVFMLEDAATPVLVTQQALAARLPAIGSRIVCLDADAPLLAHQLDSNPVSTTTIEDLAYVIYTSGSTGRPKGVQITHSSLLNLLYWHQQAFAVTAADRATQVASPAFDATGWELWPYLSIGASVWLPDEQTRVTSTLLRDWLVSQRITISFLPTSLAEQVMALEWPPSTALRYLLTGADVLHRYPSSGLSFTLINNYGPTEATVVATSGIVPSSEHTGVLPSIGRPIANTQIYLLDEHMQQVPVGEPGELYIGGVGLAKGYLNQPELTAERFIAYPFSTQSGARLYKTGDLARYLPDGQLAFIGRADHQIKIRGYRIEPDEIVAVLNVHPGVQDSLVIAHDREDSAPTDSGTGSDGKRLVAYLVPAAASETELSAYSLREMMMRYLPDYMIPWTFVLLDKLPITPNGKVDRAALPPPDEFNMLPDEAFVAPSTPIQERLAGIVASLLGIERVGVEDNFFMLGGHSLLGTQLIVRVAETFGVNVSLHALFESPTVAQLSDVIEELIIEKLEAVSDDEVLRLLESVHKQL
jgi:amino acid adenylation domain-containing protein